MARTAPSKVAAKTIASPATESARAAADPGDWLSCALAHHDQIRSAFEAARRAPPGGARIAALKGLGVILTGHSIAEEAVLYPALATVSAAKNAKLAYTEQSEAKVLMAELEQLSPFGSDWLAQVETIQAAVLKHMEQEEGSWFLDIKKNYPDQARLTVRYREEFERYTRTGIVASNGA